MVKKTNKKEKAVPKLEESILIEKNIEKKTESRKKYHQLYWILGTLAILIGIFFLSSYFFSKTNTFEYEGLTFTKEKFGEIPVFHYYYYITPQIKYNLYIRNDPRKNNIPLTGKVVDNGIEFFNSNFIYLSVNPEDLTQCEYTRVGIGTLASFLADNQLNVVGAAPFEDLAKEANVIYATCDTSPHGEEDTVIVLQAGDKTEIVHDKENCYVINVANCEILEAIEKFEVQSILDAKLRREADKN